MSPRAVCTWLTERMTPVVLRRSHSLGHTPGSRWAAARQQPPRWALGLLIGTLLSPSLALASEGLCTRDRVNGYFEEYGERDYQIDKAAFYKAVIPSYSVYKTTDGDHYRGTDAILDYWNANPRLQDPRWLAYILATSYLETAFRMFPVRETLRSSDEDVIAVLTRDYQRNPQRYRNEYWLPHEETGHSYFGRGYVQLTHHFNYKSADEELGVASREDSYYWHPEHVLDPARSILITYDGMIYGWYTGRHCLLRYFPPNQRGDWKNARRIINSLNKWQEIEEFALTFLSAIEAAKIEVEIEEQQPAEPEPVLEAAPRKMERVEEAPQDRAPPPPPPVFAPEPDEKTALQALDPAQFWLRAQDALEKAWAVLSAIMAQLWEWLKIAGAWIWDQFEALAEWVRDKQSGQDG